MGMLALSSGEADIMIKGIFHYELFGQTFWITNTHISMLIIDAVIIIFAIVAYCRMKKAELVPKGLQNVIELIAELVSNMTHQNMRNRVSLLTISELYLYLYYYVIWVDYLD